MAVRKSIMWRRGCAEVELARQAVVAWVAVARPVIRSLDGRGVGVTDDAAPGGDGTGHRPADAQRPGTAEESTA